MTTDEKWEARWKRLKEYIEEDVDLCMTKIYKPGADSLSVNGWVMARETERDILDEMVRLEKEE